MNKFEEDLSKIIAHIGDKCGKEVASKLDGMYKKLCKLYEANMVKINHSVMEVVCAADLIAKGYDVDVEYRLNDILTCDVYGVKGDGGLIVEIETGFVPPEHALDPNTYLLARVASKIARYSTFAKKFGIGTPPHNIVQIPYVFLKPPRDRSKEEVLYIKRVCDLYYAKPPISFEEILNARLYMIYVIDVDDVAVNELSPQEYHEIVDRVVKIMNVSSFMHGLGENREPL
ncbi:MAG: hypothetical protein QXO01_05505 [Nitrososphaerota archaeon]